MQINSGQARAAKYLETVNRAIILAAAVRRQGIGRGDGARSIAGLAAAPVALASITAQPAPLATLQRRSAIRRPCAPILAPWRGWTRAIRIS